MESISIFDIFKIGVGPSSSHTLGPWKAALDFCNVVENIVFDKIEIRLYGSLSKTGKGHGTKKAIQLGLLGYNPETIPTEKISGILNELKINERISINKNTFFFNPDEHIVFTNEDKPGHPNTIKFKVYLQRNLVAEETYYSIGGGFVARMGFEEEVNTKVLPYPIENGNELKNYLTKTGFTFPQLVLENEKSMASEIDVKKRIELLFDTMKASVFNGVKTEGILPGGLNVVRRAKVVYNKLTQIQPNTWEDIEISIYGKNWNFNEISQWISCFALAVNEENAAMGRIVTAPTNGSAGVIPAVLFYYYFFCPHKFSDDIEQFFLVSGEIGSLFKKGATISAAMGGCQAEIGVSSAMAAGALTQVLGGTADQVLMAAEIAMEHHLGLTCDPVGGLVQIPCIERNSMGAIKAISAANLALASNAKDCKVDLDTIIKTMWDTAKSMDNKFKETSEGGLALNIPVICTEC